MKVYQHSEPLKLTNKTQEYPIYLIYQYYVPSSKKRHLEYKHCLKKNSENSHITKIYLLNERIYNKKELGVETKNIIQYNYGKRLTYKDVFDFVDKEKLNGYIIFVNADIYLTEDIQILKKSNIHEEKSMIALLRYDLMVGNVLKIFGPRSDSQDTWIYHSNYNPDARQRTVFDFNFGKPGCDNKYAYLAGILGYKLINCPNEIKTVHVHMSEERNYSIRDLIPNPYLCIQPYNISSRDVPDRYMNYTFNDNNILREYIESAKTNYLIPRIAGVENKIAVLGVLLKKGNPNENISELIKRNASIMKNNAGILLNRYSDIIKYSDMYLKSFENCDMYAVWEPHGNVYAAIKPSHEYITTTYKKKQVWAFTFDIFHYIHSKPWTHALKGKKILIISSFVESIKEKIDIRDKIYGVDLFPDCEFVFCKPPQTNGMNSSRVFYEELTDFTKKVNELEFDVALVSCGGYGNLVCNSIYEMGKSAIYVGGVLQMYFGVYGERWLRERKDIMKLYMNEYWSRPKEEERPSNYKNIEGSSYW